jgi:hypothetical protein
MSLTLLLDANLRIVLEPGYRRAFPASELAQVGTPNDILSRRGLWNPPGTTAIMLKPLQMQPDFLNYPAQLAEDCVLRLPDFFVSPTDLAEKRIFELNVGSIANPWIGHTPVTPDAVYGPPTKVVEGIPPVFFSLTDVFNQSESGSASSWNDLPSLPSPVPADLKWLAFTPDIFPQNQAWLFRWYQPPPQLGVHQSLYAFVFAQYCALCRGALLELFEDTSEAGDRSKWTLRWKGTIFTPGLSVGSTVNPVGFLGQQLPEQQTGGGFYQTLVILPYRRQHVIFFSPTGQYFIATVRAHPRRTMDGEEWDILRADTVQAWALTPSPGAFQIQRIKYSLMPAVLDLPQIVMEYTPVETPAILMNGDTDSDSHLVPSIQFPVNYTFPTSPLADDCPAPANLNGSTQRTFGAQVSFLSSSTGKRSPELYQVEILEEPLFQDNPSPATGVLDVEPGPRVLHAEISLGSKPGDGRMTAQVLDIPAPDPPHDRALSKYDFRSEMPVQLQSEAVPVFTGYTDRTEVQPWRGDPTSPVEMRFRCNDKWLLLETSFLREQRDWQGVGHITVVDAIVRQCGIDTGDPPGSMAEYPAGWNTNLSSVYDTPLGTPILTNDNLEGNQLLGWKPQPHDTGASFLKRITDLYSNWLMGFRADGTFYYLPYTYFTDPVLTFHAEAAGREFPDFLIYRRPVEYRTIEPSGNYVQVISHYQLDLTANRSGLFVDWASIRNPKVVNYLGRPKWFIVEAGGAFSCAQLNLMAYIVFQAARRRRLRISVDADYTPNLKIGQVATLEGLGNWRLLELRATYTRRNWEIANYVFEKVEKGYGLPEP